jgi:ribosome-associated protein
MLSALDKQNIKAETKFSFARSGGPGGQHVNKTNTKVVLSWDFVHSLALTDEKKNILLPKLYVKFPNGHLILTVEETRSQFQNKELALIKLFTLIDNFLHVKPLRKETKVKKSAIEKRLSQKKKLSFIKIARKKPKNDFND